MTSLGQGVSQTFNSNIFLPICILPLYLKHYWNYELNKLLLNCVFSHTYSARNLSNLCIGGEISIALKLQKNGDRLNILKVNKKDREILKNLRTKLHFLFAIWWWDNRFDDIKFSSEAKVSERLDCDLRKFVLNF